MASDSEIRQWLREQGEQVSVKGPLSARRRAKYAEAHGGPGPRRLPTPAEAEDLPPEEFGPIIEIGDDSPQDSAPAGPGPDASHGTPPGPGPDEPPGHARREWRSRPHSAKAKAPPRVTAALRQDVTGKIGFLLQVPGSIWAARDPLCGGTFVQQLPDIADSLADWVVDSPELLALFTGPGGSWIVKAIKTAAALAPVGSVIMAHHVYHSVEAGETPAQPDYEQYAA